MTPIMPHNTTSPAPSLYSVHPGVKMLQKWIEDLPAKTGRSLDEWMEHIRAGGPEDQRAARAWLKDEHGLGTNTAWWLAERAVGASPEAEAEEDTPEGYLAAAVGYVEEQYAGKRAGLRPVYDALLKLGLGIGPEAKACPCKTIVPLYRAHVFAEIKPATNTRIDLGLALGDYTPVSKLPARVIDTGGRAKKDRITHRVAIGSVAEVDGFVQEWMRVAYGLDGAGNLRAR
jgi:hypothetical protein